MATIVVRCLPKDRSIKEALARELTDAYARIADAAKADIRIVFDEVPPQSHAVGGSIVATREHLSGQPL